MYTLILDSSNKDLYVGLLKDGKLIDEITYQAWQRQSEYMVVELEKILKKYNINKTEIESVVVGVGPGSYTGVRISLTVAKTIALALNIKLFKVSSLRVLADYFSPSICLINARGGRSYFGVYYKNEVIIKDTILKNDDVLKYIEEHKDYIVCGDAKHLAIEAKKPQIGHQIANLYANLELVEDHINLKPEYLKD